MATATTTPDDVRRYVETSLSDADIAAYIDDADAEALTFNDQDDFRDGELDRLVMFYSAYLIAFGDDAGEVKKRIEQGSRTATFETDVEEGMTYLRERIMANDPSGQLLAGRSHDADRHITTTMTTDSNST